MVGKGKCHSCTDNFIVQETVSYFPENGQRNESNVGIECPRLFRNESRDQRVSQSPNVALNDTKHEECWDLWSTISCRVWESFTGTQRSKVLYSVPISMGTSSHKSQEESWLRSMAANGSLVSAPWAVPAWPF